MGARAGPGRRVLLDTQLDPLRVRPALTERVSNGEWLIVNAPFLPCEVLRLLDIHDTERLIALLESHMLPSQDCSSEGSVNDGNRTTCNLFTY